MDFKKERLRVGNVQNMNIGAVQSHVNHEKALKNMSISKNFDRDIFTKGEEWYKSGLSLQDAPEELRKNIDFVRGFDRGKRLASITNFQSDKTR